MTIYIAEVIRRRDYSSDTIVARKAFKHYKSAREFIQSHGLTELSSYGSNMFIDPNCMDIDGEITELEIE